MITTENIKAYIDFLYRKRYGSAAPQELVAKWSTVQAHQLSENLQKLYEHWALSNDASRTYEQQFIEFLNPKQEPITAKPETKTTIVDNATIDTATKYMPTTSSSNSKSALPAIIAVCLVCIGAGYAYNYFTSKTTEDAAPVIAPTELAPANTIMPDTTAAITSADTTAVIDSSVAATSTSPDIATTPSTNSLSTYQPIVQQLLKADEEQDLSTTLNLFGDEVSQYYDLIRPSKDEIANNFSASWGKASNRRYYNVEFNSLSDRSIEANGMMEYYSIKEQQVRNVPFTARYVFNEYGKIIYQNKN
jgi:hypothetical protein